LAVPFCHPFVITRHSSWLFTFTKYSCRDHCSTAVCSDCMCYVRRCGNPMAEMCCCCGSTGGGWARLKAVSGLRWLSVCSRCQLDTNRSEKIGRSLKNKIFVRTIVLLSVFAKLQKVTVSSAMLSVRPHGTVQNIQYNVSEITNKMQHCNRIYYSTVH